MLLLQELLDDAFEKRVKLFQNRNFYYYANANSHCILTTIQIRCPLKVGGGIFLNLNNAWIIFPKRWIGRVGCFKWPPH